MSREFETDLTGGLSDEERFVLRVAAELDASLSVLTSLERAQLDAARHSALRHAGIDLATHASAPSAHARVLLTGSAEQLPSDIRQRLDDIRAQAMCKARATQRERSVPQIVQWLRMQRTFAVPAGAFASVCVLLTTLAIFTPSEIPDVLPVALSEDGLLIASAEELELYQNLEFYQWLADNGLQN